jgi:histidine phosphotransfer protein HptB
MIDLDRLAELRDEIGADDLAEVVDMFLDEADEVMARLTAAGDPGPLEAPLHFLKGSALNLGLAEFAALCQDGEKRAAAGDPAPADLGRLGAVYAASKSAFLAALADRAA